MSKSSPEQVVDFLLGLLPNLLPKPVDSMAKSAIESFRGSLDHVLKEPRLKQDLLEAARRAESEFRKQGQSRLGNNDLVQAVASFPLFDNNLFQSTLASLPNHLREDYIANDLQELISSDWKGKFSAKELQEGVALYLNCLRIELLNVDGFAEVVTNLAILRADQRTEQILAIVTELSKTAQKLIDHNNYSTQANAQSIKLKTLQQLPPKVEDFTGRETLIDELLNDFEKNKGVAISSLTGMGGVGKTALGLEIAHHLSEKYTDGNIFLDLKGTTSPLKPSAIMRHVILSFEPTADLSTADEANLSTIYQSILRDKKVLLFFDNARSSEQIAPLRPPSSCAILVTSRWTFPLIGLNSHRVGVLEEEEAANFLMELCPRIQKDEAITLSFACGYLPLALRIAGSFLQVNDDWQVDDYLARLANSKKRLETLQESRKEAEMSDEYDLIATFDTSYNQLSYDEQRYWRMLSVFPVSFEWAAATDVWNIDKSEAKKFLGVFRRYSLLDFNEIFSRYELHDLLYEFARTKILKSESKLAKQRHSLFYSKGINTITQFAFSGENNFTVALAALDHEWENIITGFRFATSKNDIEYLNAISAYTKAYDIIKLRLHSLELIRWLTLAVAATRRTNDMQALAGHLGDLGIAYLSIGKIEKSIDCHKKSFDIAQTINVEFIRDQLTSNALGNMGQAYEDKGDYKTAEKYYKSALTLSKKWGNLYSEAEDLLNLGGIKSKVGENEEAIDFVTSAMRIFNKLGFSSKEGSCLIALSNIYTKLHQVEAALEYLERAQKLYTDLGDVQNYGVCLQNYGNAYMELKKYELALEYTKKALDIAIASSDLMGIAQRTMNIGTTLCKLEKQEEAIPYFERAISTSLNIGAYDVAFLSVSNLSTVYMELDKFDKAKETLLSVTTAFPAESDYSRNVKSLHRHSSLFNARSWGELSTSDQALWIVGQVVADMNTNHKAEAQKAVSQLMSNVNTPVEFQELCRVLQRYTNGEKELDLSGLPNEIAKIVRSELNL
ncbi:MAG: hypothetical protein DYG87_01195 [Anaerolineae bacterium CFX3]|nr:hypothetical protein [Anaerolineae bacterium CFX3]MCQ3946211.1 hypothetical protein [Anaerolineae bacterium]